MTTHDPTPHNMAMIVIYKDDLHYLQRAGRRVKKKEIDLLHDIIEKHRRPGAAASEGGRKPHDSTKDEDQGRTIPEGEVIYMPPSDTPQGDQKPSYNKTKFIHGSLSYTMEGGRNP